MEDPYELAKTLAVDGHNLIIVGQAGSGKSFLLKEIITGLSQEGKLVQACASTNLAASLLPGKTEP